MPNKKTILKPVILVTGKDGQVGWELQRSVGHLGDVVACDVKEMDLSDVDSIVSVLRSVKPDIIINPAAYTAVDKAEEESELAMKVNGVAPGVIAEEAEKLKALLIHYSTDYVFNGLKDGAYTETDEPDPKNIYGVTKLAGEQAIQSSNVNHLIFRTSWVYASRGQNFLHSMLRLAKQRQSLSIVDDQLGAPTWARTISEATLHTLILAQKDLKSGEFESGIYNLVASGQTSWCGFSRKIINFARNELGIDDLVVESINPITTEEYPTPAQRPLNSLLSTEKLANKYGVYLPTWEQSLELCMMELR